MKSMNGFVQSDEIDGVIDFDKDICDGHKMQDAFDSGDHLHPSDEDMRKWQKPHTIRCPWSNSMDILHI